MEVNSAQRKTKLCKRYLLGKCIWGDECPLAHSQNELSEAQDLWKTRWCTVFTTHGHCEAGADCAFAHNLDELRSPKVIYKSRHLSYAGAGDAGGIHGQTCSLAENIAKPKPQLAEEPMLAAGRHRVKVERMTANPHEVLFSHPRIIDRFTCGRTVESTIQDLARGVTAISDIPAIRVVRRSGKLMTLDHRRLFAFRAALPIDAQIPVKLLLSDDFAEMQGVSTDHKPRRSVSMQRTLPRRPGSLPALRS